VERNPVRASLVRKAEEYPWSSAAAHCGLRSDRLLSPLLEPRRATEADWSDWLAAGDDKTALAKLRLHTRTGRPIGNKSFVTELESRLGRRLHSLPVGRPPKSRKS